MSIELNGKHNTAKVFTDNIDSETISQVIELLNQEFIKDSQIRIMPDCHAGKGCVVGTTMTLKDKVVPNLVGVDIGCLDKDTEVLTPNGWIKISQYDNQEILIYDKLNQIAKFEQPLAYINMPCEEFYHFHHSKGLDQVFSEEHKMLLWKGYKGKGYNQEILLAKDFVDDVKKKTKIDYYGTKTTFHYNGKGLGLSDNMIRILVMISADGCVKYDKNKSKTYVGLHLKKERKINRACDLLTNGSFKFSKSVAKDGSTFIYFTLPFFYDKSLECFYNASSEQLAIVHDEIYNWDGTVDLKRNHKHFSSTDKKNADVVQFVLATQNIRAGISTITDTRPNFSPCYSVYETLNPIVSYNSNESIDIIKSIDGRKYCFTTSTGFFIIRRNNCISITGNCGMYAVKLEESDIDLKLLDTVINNYVPSGFGVHDCAIADYKGLSDIICHVNIDSAKQAIGSLGGGNHFIEVDRDKDGNLWLVIHCGSRHLGLEVCDHYQEAGYTAIEKESVKIKIDEKIKELKAKGLEREIETMIKIIKMQVPNIPKHLAYVEGTLFDDYIHDMNLVQEYAKINRQTIADIIISKMDLHPVDMFDTIHNYIDVKNMILRKGSISAQKDEKVLIPMNMRDGSLICIGKGNPDWNYSAPHGAGRIMSRSQAKTMVDMDEFTKSMSGIYSTSVVESTRDEAPMVYKPMDEIIKNIEDTVDVVDVIKPIYNFKAH